MTCWYNESQIELHTYRLKREIEALQRAVAHLTALVEQLASAQVVAPPTDRGDIQPRILRYLHNHEPVELRTVIAELTDVTTTPHDIRSTILLLTCANTIAVDVTNHVTLTQQGLDTYAHLFS